MSFNISIATLRTVLRYDSATGKLYWRERCSDLFNATESRTAEHSCRRWNSQYANKEAFTYVTPKGYKTGCIFGQIYLAHRVIWAMQTGAWPVDQLDQMFQTERTRETPRFGATTLAASWALTGIRVRKNGRRRSERQTGFKSILGISQKSAMPLLQEKPRV